MSSTKIDREIVKIASRSRKKKLPKRPKIAEQAADKAADAKLLANVGEETFRDKDGRTAKVIRMREKLERPEMLVGSTYKIKTPISDHAMYVTINDIVLNEGTGTSSAGRSRSSSTRKSGSLPVDRGAHPDISAVFRKAATSRSWWTS